MAATACTCDRIQGPEPPNHHFLLPFPLPFSLYFPLSLLSQPLLSWPLPGLLPLWMLRL
ncbi:hypothetical protein D3C73_1429630 [compost metagenome]